MTAVNCQDKPAVAPPLDVVRDGIEGRSAGVGGGLSGASAPHSSGVCTTAPLPLCC